MAVNVFKYFDITMFGLLRRRIMPTWKIIDPSGAAELLKAVAHPQRLRILDRLSGGVLCVSEVEAELGMPQPTVSGHLNVLRKAGLVECRTVGRKRCYYICDGRADEIVRIASSRAGEKQPPPACTRYGGGKSIKQ